MNALSLLVSLHFLHCEQNFDEALVRGVVKAHAANAVDAPLAVTCDGGRVRIEGASRQQDIALAGTEPSLRPQLVALSILGTMAELRFPDRDPDLVRRRLTGGLAIGFAIGSAVLLGVGLAVIIPAVRAQQTPFDEDARIKAGLGLSISGAILFTAAAVPFGFWLRQP